MSIPVSIYILQEGRFALLDDVVQAIDARAESYRRMADAVTDRDAKERLYLAELTARALSEEFVRLNRTNDLMWTPSSLAEMDGLPDILDEVGIDPPVRDWPWRRRRIL